MKFTKLTILPALTIMAIIFLSSCGDISKIKSEKITVDNLSDIADKAKTDEGLSREDISLFINGLTRLAGHKDSLVGKTVGGIIDKEKDIIRESNLKLLKSASIRTEISFDYKIKYMGLNFGNDSTTKTPINVLYFEVTNTTDKDLKLITGMLQLFNQQNQLVKQFPVKYTIALAPGKTVQFAQTYTHSDADQRDMLVRTDKNLSYLWNPETLELANGKKLTLVEETKK